MASFLDPSVQKGAVLCGSHNLLPNSFLLFPRSSLVLKQLNSPITVHLCFASFPPSTSGVSLLDTEKAYIVVNSLLLCSLPLQT